MIRSRHIPLIRYTFVMSLFAACAYASCPMTDNVTKAKEMSAAYNRPLVLIFTASDWSLESGKLLGSIIHSDPFSQEVEGQFIFAGIDFPDLNRKQYFILDQGHQLKEEFHVESFPTLIMLDPEGIEVTRVGYLDLGPTEYARHLKDRFMTYCLLKNAFHKIDGISDGATLLESLYEKAEAIGCTYYKDKIVERGMQLDDGVFFLLEKYTSYVHEGKENLPEAIALREKIKARDPHNKQKARLRLALLDFQAHENEPEKATISLESYIREFGESDKDNLFKLHRLISDYFFHVEKEQHIEKCASSS